MDIEESVITYVLQNSSEITTISKFFLPEHFTHKSCQILYAAAIELKAADIEIDAVQLIIQLKKMGDSRLNDVGGTEEVQRLFMGSFSGTASQISVQSSIDFLIELSKRRDFSRKMQDILHYRIGNLEIPFNQIVETITEAYAKLITHARQPDNGLTPISSTIGDTADWVVERTLSKRQGVETGISSGWIDIDEHTGGWQPNDLIIVGARPAVGKSSFAISTCMTIAKKHPVAFFSLEMDKRSIETRCLAMHSSIDSEKIRDGKLSDIEIREIFQAAEDLKHLNYWGTDKFSPSIDFVVSECRKLAAKHGQLGAIAIDYIQLMVVDQNNKINEVSDITRKLKLLAIELRCPVFGLSQLNRGLESRNDKRPIKSDLRDSGCLTGDTLVEMADTGVRVPIKELQGLSGFNVWSLNQATLKLEKALVSNAFSTGAKQTFTLTTKLGKVIRATGNHKFLKIDGWSSLDEITAGDRIALPRQVPVTNSTQTMSDNELALLSHDKFVPDLVFNQPQAAIATFLGHLWATDGSITLDKNNQIGFHYSSSSRKLANDVQSLLLRIGVISVVRTVQQGKHRNNFSVCISGESDTINFFNQVKLVKPGQIAAAELITAYYESINENTNKDIIPKSVVKNMAVNSSSNFSRERLMKVASKLGPEELKTLATSDIYWDEVKSVEIDLVEEVFDLTVPANSNFLANDIIVHNSLEQDADIIIMLYRDILYNPDTMEPDIAEVIFRKFRGGRDGTVKLVFDGASTQFRNLAKKSY